MTRGDWKVVDGKATVKFNEERFTKYKNHGAMVAYKTPLRDAEVVVRFTPRGADAVVFTFDTAGQDVRLTINGETFSATSPLIDVDKTLTKLSIQRGDLEISQFEIHEI